MIFFNYTQCTLWMQAMRMWETRWMNSCNEMALIGFHGMYKFEMFLVIQ